MQLRHPKAYGPRWDRQFCSVVGAFKMHRNDVITMKCKGNEIPWSVLKDLRIKYFVLLIPSCISRGPTDRFVGQGRK